MASNVSTPSTGDGEATQASDPNSDGKTILTLPNGIGVREWRASDAASAARSGNNRRIWDNLRDRMPHPYTPADAAWWISQCRGPSCHVASGAFDPSTGTGTGPLQSTNYCVTIDDVAVGAIGLDFGSDVRKRVAELGYWLGEEHWGKGVMSAVVPAYVAWAWRTFDRLVRLDGEYYEWNKASGKLLEKAGFKYEGRREAAVWKNGKIGATLLYGCIRPGLFDEK
ncbi:hypothetical protein H2203_005416 [Taxawa tesnikishii (nom. ined.)]|nr:hypothetical protein H2203_005416 [Dothideales sp. JES 119]